MSEQPEQVPVPSPFITIPSPQPVPEPEPEVDDKPFVMADAGAKDHEHVNRKLEHLMVLLEQAGVIDGDSIIRVKGTP